MFQKITRRSTSAGRSLLASPAAGGDRNSVQHHAGHFAIVLDNQLQSTPYIDYTDAQLQNGIAGRRRADHDGIAVARRRTSRSILQTGALPVSFKHDRAHRRLGDARQGLADARRWQRRDRRPHRSSRIFLLVLYRFLGLVAVVGLAIYAASSTTPRSCSST